MFVVVIPITLSRMWFSMPNMNNVYSCRKIKQASRRDIHCIWQAGYEKSDFATINRFAIVWKWRWISSSRSWCSCWMNAASWVWYSFYIDEAKLESNANKYAFVRLKTVERNRARLREKIKVLLEQEDNIIVLGQGVAPIWKSYVQGCPKAKNSSPGAL